MPQTQINDGTFIPIVARPGKAATVANLLRSAAQLVRETEPQTLQWLALQEEANRFAIVDFFAGPEGRAAHFAGQVAAALKGASEETLEGGWENGVIAHVENVTVLSATVTTDPRASVTLATRIDMRARPGQEEALAAFLKQGAAIVRATEPGTLLWYAVRLDAVRYAIFDAFATEEGLSGHFAGRVAAALKKAASDLVDGGWETGVVKKIRHYAVLSATF